MSVGAPSVSRDRTAYLAYLASDAWKARRMEALQRSARAGDATPNYYSKWPRCEVCGRSGSRYKNLRSSLDYRDARYRVDGANGLQVHHLHYRTLGRETPGDLIVLCTDVAVWIASGYRDLTSRAGCHERAHDDATFRAEVARRAAERRY